VLALSLYMASCPLVFEWSQRSGFGRFLVPATRMFYAPVFLWVQRPQWPGSAAYLEYANWTIYHLNEPDVGNAESNAQLGWPATVDFTATPLQDVIKFLSNMRGLPIELDPEVDGDIEVTIKSAGSLRDVLKELLEPLGLVAWPADGRIAIGTPAAIQRVRAEDRATHLLPDSGWLMLALLCISATSLLILLRRRRSILTQPAG